MREKVREFQQGEPITAARLNELVRAANHEVIATERYQVDNDKTVIDNRQTPAGDQLFSAVVVCEGPDEEANPTDETYWIQFVTHTEPASSGDPVGTVTTGNNIVLATNEFEIPFGTHNLSTGTHVEARQVTDDGGNKQWVFNQPTLIWAAIIAGIFGACGTSTARGMGVLSDTNHWYHEATKLTDLSFVEAGSPPSESTSYTMADGCFFDDRWFLFGNIEIDGTTYPIAYFDDVNKRYVGVSGPFAAFSTCDAAVLDADNDAVFLAVVSTTLSQNTVWKMTGSGGSYSFTSTGLQTSIGTATETMSTNQLKIVTDPRDDTRKLIWCGVSFAASPSWEAFGQMNLSTNAWTALSSGASTSFAEGYDVCVDGDSLVVVGIFADLFGVTGANGILRLESGSNSKIGPVGLTNGTQVAAAVESYGGIIWVGWSASATDGRFSAFDGTSWVRAQDIVRNLDGSGIKGQTSSVGFFTGGITDFEVWARHNALMVCGIFQKYELNRGIASTGPVVGDDGSDFVDALPTIDGRVNVIRKVGSKLLIGGAFRVDDGSGNTYQNLILYTPPVAMNENGTIEDVGQPNDEVWDIDVDGTDAGVVGAFTSITNSDATTTTVRKFGIVDTTDGSWTEPGNVAGGDAYAVAYLSTDGSWEVGGDFTTVDSNSDYAVLFNWKSGTGLRDEYGTLSGAAPVIRSIFADGTNVYVGGIFTGINTATSGSIAYRAEAYASSWNGMSSGIGNNRTVWSIEGHNGDIYVGTDPDAQPVGETNYSGLWSWDSGSGWSEPALGLGTFGGATHAMRSNGATLYTALHFQDGLNSPRGIWSWSAGIPTRESGINEYFDDEIRSIDYVTRIYAGGYFSKVGTGTGIVDRPLGGIGKIVRKNLGFEIEQVAGGCMPIPYATQFLEPGAATRMNVATVDGLDCDALIITGNFFMLSDKYAQYVCGISATSDRLLPIRGGIGGALIGSAPGEAQGVRDIKSIVEARDESCDPTQLYVPYFFGAFSFADNAPIADGEQTEEIISAVGVVKLSGNKWRKVTATSPPNTVHSGIPKCAAASNKLVLGGPFLNPQVYTGDASSGSYADLVTLGANPGGLNVTAGGGGPTYLIESTDGTLWLLGAVQRNPGATVYPLLYYNGSIYIGHTLTDFTSGPSSMNHATIGDLGDGLMMYAGGQPDDAATGSPPVDNPVWRQTVAGKPGTWAAVGTNLTGVVQRLAFFYADDQPYLVAFGNTNSMTVGGTPCQVATFTLGGNWVAQAFDPGGTISLDNGGVKNWGHPCDSGRRRILTGGLSTVAVNGGRRRIQSVGHFDLGAGQYIEGEKGVDQLVRYIHDPVEHFPIDPKPVSATFVSGTPNKLVIEFDKSVDASISSTSNLTVVYDGDSYAITAVTRDTDVWKIELTLGSTSSSGDPNEVSYAGGNSDWIGVIRQEAIAAFDLAIA